MSNDIKINNLYDKLLSRACQLDTLTEIFGDVTGITTGSICADSDDKLHHANVADGQVYLDEQGRQYTKGTCKHCQSQFPVYGMDLYKSYTAVVNQYESEDSLGYLYTSIPASTVESSCAVFELVDNGDNWNTLSLMTNTPGSGCIVYVEHNYSWTPPITGVYKPCIVFSSNRGFYYNTFNRFRLFHKQSWPACLSDMKGYGWEYGKNIKFNGLTIETSTKGFGSLIYFDRWWDSKEPFRINFKIYLAIKPAIGVSLRVDQIIDKPLMANGVLYNPVTGIKTNISEWNYNFKDRTYTMTSEDDIVIRVIYDVENIKVIEGVKVYEIPYSGVTSDVDDDYETGDWLTSNDYVKVTIENKDYYLIRQPYDEWLYTYRTPPLNEINPEVITVTTDDGKVTIETSDERLAQSIGTLISASQTPTGSRMLEYYPQAISELLEFQALIHTLGFEIDFLNVELYMVLNDAYLIAMGEERLIQWERALGISPLKNSTIEDRRAVIIGRVSTGYKLNTASINNIVNVFTGGSAHSWFADSCIHVEVQIPPNNKQYIFKNVENELKRRIPAHLTMEVTREFADWKFIRDNFKNWEDVKTRCATWEDVTFQNNHPAN